MVTRHSPLTNYLKYEVAIESWPEWNLNPNPMYSAEML